MTIRRAAFASSILVLAALAGCGDPTYGPQASIADSQCASLRKELNAMDAKGVPSLIERKNNGGKLSAQQDAEVSRYNSVLNSYLGGQCASDARYKANQGRRITTGSVKKKTDQATE
jgi:hypothetical protein